MSCGWWSLLNCFSGKEQSRVIARGLRLPLILKFSLEIRAERTELGNRISQCNYSFFSPSKALGSIFGSDGERKLMEERGPLYLVPLE